MKTLNLKTLPVKTQKCVILGIKTLIFTKKPWPYHFGFDFIIKPEVGYIQLNNHFLIFLSWFHVSGAGNGFQKFVFLLLKVMFLPNFNTTAPLCASNSSDSILYNL